VTDGQTDGRNCDGIYTCYSIYAVVRKNYVENVSEIMGIAMAEGVLGPNPYNCHSVIENILRQIRARTCRVVFAIVVINVKKKIKKNVKKRVFYLQNKKTFVNVIKNVTIFLLAFDVRAYHRLNGSSSPVLTATCLSYGSL